LLVVAWFINRGLHIRRTIAMWWSWNALLLLFIARIHRWLFADVVSGGCCCGSSRISRSIVLSRIRQSWGVRRNIRLTLFPFRRLINILILLRLRLFPYILSVRRMTLPRWLWGLRFKVFLTSSIDYSVGIGRDVVANDWVYFLWSWLHLPILRFIRVGFRLVLMDGGSVLLRLSMSNYWLFLNFPRNDIGRPDGGRRRHYLFSALYRVDVILA